MDSDNDYLLYNGMLTMVEFVAVPTTLDIEHYLTMRETTGFKDAVNKKQLIIICEAVKNSTIFAMVNNRRISIETIFAFLQILKELNLIIKVGTNPLAGKEEMYMRVAEAYSNRDADGKPATVVFINLLMLHQEGLMDKALKSVVEIDEYYEDINKTIKTIGKFDWLKRVAQA